MRLFGKSPDLGGKPATVRQIAIRLNEVAPTYVAGLLQDLADRPLDGYTARLVTGTGKDANWTLAKVEETVPPAEPIKAERRSEREQALARIRR